MSALSGVLIVAGAAFTMLAGIGALRFGDVYTRMHPAAKGPTLGLLLVAVGALIELRSLPLTLALLLVVVLQFLASPVGTHLVGRAVHERLNVRIDTVDEWSEDVGTPAGLDSDAQQP